MDNQLIKLQNTQLAILKDVAAVCKKYNITYYLSDGTCLGAIRHKGFIPWDDDVDIAMPMEDYRRFLAIGQEELGETYFLQNCTTDDCFQWGFSKVRMNNTTMMHRIHKKYHGHQGIWIDIFPIVRLSNKFEWKIKKLTLSVSNYIKMDDFFYANYEEFSKRLGKVGTAVLRLFYCIPFTARKKLHKKVLDFVCGGRGKKYVAQVCPGLSKPYTQNSCLGAPTEVEFSNNTFYCFSDPVKYLEEQYGNWELLPPIEKRKGHGDLIVDFQNSYTLYLEK